MKEIAAGARRVAELELAGSAFEVKKSPPRVAPADPLKGDRRGERIDAAAIEVDDDRPACSAGGVGAAQNEGARRDGGVAAGRSDEKAHCRSQGSHAPPNSADRRG